MKNNTVLDFFSANYLFDYSPVLDSFIKNDFPLCD